VAVGLAAPRRRAEIGLKTLDPPGIDRACHSATRMRARSISVAVASIAFLLTCALSMHAQTAVTVNVDALLNRHPINPNIYGVAHASAADLTDLNTPLNRNGGNNTSRYNWQLNADNRGNDWF
jgi:hypothetical protein